MNKILEQLVWIGTKPNNFVLSGIYMTQPKSKIIFVHTPTGEQLEFLVSDVRSDYPYIASATGKAIQGINMKLTNPYVVDVEFVSNYGRDSNHSVVCMISLEQIKGDS